MAAGLVILSLAVLLVGLTLLMSSQRRVDEARRAEALALADNARLLRALGTAEQALRSIGNDTRLDAALGLQVDAALSDVSRATGELGQG
jgi:type II secretory pathway pseudopilin PulG